jgi:threonine 3-dehydrogenase
MEKILVTGVSGEVGFGLVKKLKETSKDCHIMALDLKKPSEEILGYIDDFIECDITDKQKVMQIVLKGGFSKIFHLASILSTGAEKNPETAIAVNIEGTINLLESANQSSLNSEKSVIFLFPSSIAAFGDPITSYGIAKQACEKLGTYFSQFYKLLDHTIDRNKLIDFRSVRFPGLLSPDTVPTGGTSDYGPEMLHAAARGAIYECYVRPDSTIPFMAMADAVEILVKLANTQKYSLKSKVYDLSGFSVSAAQIEQKVKSAFPNANITYKVDENRQRIVDSWPKSVESTQAVNDWGYNLRYDFDRTFDEYLIPKIKARYSK